MVCARGHAAAIGTALIFGATVRASLLTGDFLGLPTPRSGGKCHQRSLQKRPAMSARGQPLDEEIELARIHRCP
jgi:hypothetical protein